MTKADIVARVVAPIGPRVAEDDCAQMIDSLLAAVRDALATGESIQLRGFGTFEVKRRRPRQGRNPRTGEPVPIPARGVRVFRPSQHLRGCVERGRRLSVTGESIGGDAKPALTRRARQARIGP